MSKMKLFVPDKAPSHRQEKVAEEVRHIISDALIRGDLPTLIDQDGEYFSLKTPVTVSQVTISPDLRHATAYVMPLGGEDKNTILSYLSATAPEFRKILSKKLSLRVAPTIAFELDKSFDYAEHINDILKKL